jgi:hypothetical protein
MYAETLNQKDWLENIFQQFNGQAVYGLELILDELSPEPHHSYSDASASQDWFGLEDLTI